MSWGNSPHDRAALAANSVSGPGNFTPLAHLSPDLKYINEEDPKYAITGRDDDNDAVAKTVKVVNNTENLIRSKEITALSYDDLKAKIHSVFGIPTDDEIDLCYGVNNVFLNNKNFDFIEDQITFKIKKNYEDEAMVVENILDNAGKPFRICDASRKSKKILSANSQSDLLLKIHNAYNIPSDEEIRIYLACNGALIVDNEFVEYSEDYTKYMFLRGEEKWLKKVDGLQHISEGSAPTDRAAYLVWRIIHDDCTLSQLEDAKLDILINMNVADVNTYLLNKQCTLFENETTLIDEIQNAAKNTLKNNVRGKQAHQFLEELKKINFNEY